ncbi:ATP-binding cassette domain-containing protein [Glutamicibacter sp. JC586]|uniref:ATP-binding cassette domain-containing protein n=1 Tax=Glutamicibacter sp. JC586 TaxID=2590552 RepID=UPI00135BD683|nr:ATP-binding cassette domain-containing protein [Glutamicibacter sp. JC586]
MNQSVLETTNISATRGFGTATRQILTPISLSLNAGESLAIVGPSGAGKSTLAEIILGLGTPATGEVKVLGQTWSTPIRNATKAQRVKVQGVPQDAVAAFVPRWTIRKSLEVALAHLAPELDVERQIHQSIALASFDPTLLNRLPRELSGGQGQRAALARALVVRPALLVADEPTSALDPTTAAQVADQLFVTAKKTGVALLLVTHDSQLAARCTRTITITAH